MAPDDMQKSAEDALNHPRVVEAVARYQAELDAGRRPNREAYLREYAEVAAVLDGCLEALDFVGGALGQLKKEPASTQRDELRSGVVIGDFQIVREIGRGGMGVVYEAVQLSLGRRVALKALPRMHTSDSHAIQRFQHEAQAAASVQHPNIVSVYFIGQTEQRHFFVMQLIEGIPLTKVIEALRCRRAATTVTPGEGKDTTIDCLPDTTSTLNNETFRRIANWLQQAARALQHAHEVGIIHRDIKPGNLLLEKSEHLWVADFGLAKLPGSDLTQSDAVLGTIRYMSPEQASGRAVALDGRTDIYSLGVTAYELLTLQPAFTADDRCELLRRVLHDEPVPLRRHNPKIPVELETIVQKAMAKEPAERYATAAEFADDIQRFLDHRPIHAKPATTAQRLRKWSRRHRVFVSVSGVAAVLLLSITVILLVVSNLAIDKKRQEKEEALERESTALTKEREATAEVQRLLQEEQRTRAQERRTSYLYSFGLAYREWKAGDLATTQLLLNETPSEHRRWEWEYVKQLSTASIRTITRNEQQGKIPLGVQFTREGHLFTPVQGEFRWWSSPEGKRIGTIVQKQLKSARRAILSPNGLRVLTVSFVAAKSKEATGEMLLWNKQTGEVLTSFKNPSDEEIFAAFTHDSQKIISAGNDQKVRIWDVRTGNLLQTCAGHIRPVQGIACPQQGPWFASFGMDSSIRIWHVDTGQLVRTITDAAIWPSSNRLPVDYKRLDIRADGRAVAVGMTNGTVKVWDTATGRAVALLEGHSREVENVQFSPDGRYLATSGRADSVVKIWDIATERLVRSFHMVQPDCDELRFHPTGRLLGVLEKNATIEFFDISTPEEALVLGRAYPTDRLFAIQRGLNHFAFSPNGQRLVASVPGEIAVWNLLDGQRVYRRTVPKLLDEQSISHVGFAGAADSLLVFGETETEKIELPTQQVTRWPIATMPRRNAVGGPVAKPNPKAILTANYPMGQQVAFSREARYFAAINGETNQQIALYNATTGQEVTSFGHDNVAFTRLALSRDASKIAAYSAYSGNKRLVLVWETNTKQLLWSQSLKPFVQSLDFDDVGDRLAIAFSDGTFQTVYFGPPTEERVYQAIGRGAINCLTFSKDGQRLAFGLRDTNDATTGIRLVDVTTGRELFTLPTKYGAIHHLAFSPDGATLAAVDESGRISLFAARPVEQRLAWWKNRATDWHREEAYAAIVTGSPEAILWHINKVVAAAPNDEEFQNLRNSTRSKLLYTERFEPEVAAQKESELTIKSGLDAYRLAAQYLEDKDLAAYQRVCERMLSLVKPGASSFDVSLVYRLCVLGPNGTKDYAGLLKNTPQLFNDPKHPFIVPYLTGSLHYRLGDYKAARQFLLETQKHDPTANAQVLVWLFLAMTEHQLHNPREAKAALDKADEWYRTKLGQFAVKGAAVEYQVAIPFTTLRKEVAELLGER